jgi:hypothetical protein
MAQVGKGLSDEVHEALRQVSRGSDVNDFTELGIKIIRKSLEIRQLMVKFAYEF